MNKNIFPIIIGVIVVLAIFAVLKFNSDEEQAMLNEIGSSPTSRSVKTDDSAVTNSNKNWYVDYSEEALSFAIEEGKRPVLFFHANWCPQCIAAAKDLNANVDQIPEDVTILKADYDTEIALKQKYRIVYQDTFVQLDSDMQEVSKWNSGGEGIKTLLENLQ